MGTIKNICTKCGTVYILKQLRSVRERFNTVFATSGWNGPIQDSRSTLIHLLDPYQTDLIAPSQKYTDRISMEIMYIGTLFHSVLVILGVKFYYK